MKIGAIVNRMAHQYMHSLPREQEEIINDMLRDFKIELDVASLIANEHTLNIYEIRKKVFSEDRKDSIYIQMLNNDEEIEKKRNKKNKNTKKKDKYKNRIYFYDEENEER